MFVSRWASSEAFGFGVSALCFHAWVMVLWNRYGTARRIVSFKRRKGATGQGRNLPTVLCRKQRGREDTG